MSSVNAVLTSTSELPGQRILSWRQWANIATLTSPLLPFPNVSVVDEVAVETESELEWKMDDGEWTRRHILCVQDHDIVPKHVEVIHEGNQIPFSFGAAFFRNEGWFLERCSRTLRVSAPMLRNQFETYRPKNIFRSLIPRKMTKHIEQATSWRPAFCEVVRLRRIDLSLPKMVVWFRQMPVVNSREFPIYLEDFRRGYS